MAAKNKNTKKTSKNREKTSVFSVLLSVALVAVIVFGVLVLFDESKVGDNPTKDETETSDVETDEDSKDDTNTATIPDKDTSSDETSTDNTKDAYEQDQQSSNAELDDNGKKVATPYISINQNNEIVIISARITSFKEEGGSCAYTISKGAESKTYTKSVLPDAKAMVCEALRLNKSELSSGEWTVKVEYKSNTAEGQSEAQKFTI